MAKLTQKELIANHLDRVGSIEPYRAFHLYRITCLAQVIQQLRREWVVHTEHVRHKGGYHARYSWG